MTEIEARLEYERDNAKNLYIEIRKLKEQMENAIVPKFKVGQEVFTVIGNEIDEAKVEKIVATIGKTDEETFSIYSITDSHGYAVRLPEEQIFFTREEAEQEIKKSKGEN